MGPGFARFRGQAALAGGCYRAYDGAVPTGGFTMTRCAVVVWIAGLLAAACTNVKQVPDETAVRDIIDAQNQELVECWNGGEYECVAAAFSEEGWQMMPNAQAQAGTEAIRRF
jgi:hypothetical protein